MIHVDESEIWTKQQRIKVKTKNHWAKLRVKTQNKSQYYDVLAGKRDTNPHIHMGFTLLGDLLFNEPRGQVTSMERRMKSEMHGVCAPEGAILAEKDGKVSVVFTATIVGDVKESAVSLFGLIEKA